MLDDRDADIRGLALDALEQIDPRIVAGLLPRLRKQLASLDDNEVLRSAWLLATLGDQASIDPLQDFRDAYEPWMWQHKAAEVVLLLMTEPERIADRIRQHDHEHMGWLAHAATLLGSVDALGALEMCAREAPDESCRNVCSDILARSRAGQSGGRIPAIGTADG